MTGSRQRGWAILVAAIAVIATACGGPKAHPAPKPKPTPPPAAPAVGACRNLTFASAAAASDDTPTVPCTSRHTAITVAVGTLVAKSQVKHLDINAPAVQQLLAVSCPHAVETYTGARAGIFDLSQIQAIPFVPTPTQIARGANWYRCDLVVLAAPNTLARVLGTMHLALKPARALDRWGTCGNTSPSSASFRRELCSRPQHWRAVSQVSLPKNAT
ncbi:MAG: septum formation family protein [Marmoricola sp.]